jgi:hypothetical protein
MARIDYAISVTPIQASQYDVTYDSAEAGTSTTNTDIDYVDPEIGRSLGGGNSSTTWSGNPIATPNWESGAADYYQSGDSSNTFAVDSGAEGLWIKHSGFNYDATATNNIGSTTNDILVTVTGATDMICKLKGGEAIFLPMPLAQTITFTDATGSAAAMEVAVLT